MLSRSQRLLRRIDTFPRPFQYVENKNRHVPSFFKFLYRNFIYNLSQKLKVNESILDFNLIRLSEVTKQIALDHNSDQTRPMLNMAFHMHEWPIALEIFLQIDGKQTSHSETIFSLLCNFSQKKLVQRIFCFFFFLQSRFIFYENMHLSWFTSSIYSQHFIS